VFFALLYVIGSVFVGGMLVLGNFPGGYSWTVLWNGPPGTGTWNYPGLLVVAPWGVVSLPFFATLSMLVVSVGVGLGMTVAFLLVVRLLKPKREGAAGSSSAGAVAGLTPAMISLVTLGACCSTTAAATAGVGLVAQASGTSSSNLLLNNWYLGVFQIVVVWIALLGQELLLIVYAGLFGRAETNHGSDVLVRRVDRRFVASSAVRLALLVGGVLWSLSMVAEWTSVSPSGGSIGTWFQWIVQHQVVAGLAISAALFPRGTLRGLQTVWTRTNLLLPLLIGIAGATVLWSPPPFSSWGLDGLTNQVLYVLNAPAGWGTISPGPLGGVALAARWGFEYALLGGFAVSVAIAPEKTFTLLRWSLEETRVSAPASAVVSKRSDRSSGEGGGLPGDSPGAIATPVALPRGR
jgi:hypothetical protein